MTVSDVIKMLQEDKQELEKSSKNQSEFDEPITRKFGTHRMLTKEQEDRLNKQNKEPFSLKRKRITHENHKKKKSKRSVKWSEYDNERTNHRVTCCKKKKCCLNPKFTEEVIKSCRFSLHNECKNETERRTKLNDIYWRGGEKWKLLDDEVCIEYFIFVYHVSRQSLTSAAASGGRRLLNCRRSDKTRICCDWLDEFAMYHEIMPDTNFIQLPYANKKIVYDFFKSDRFPLETNNQISESFFYRVWREKRQQIKLRKYLRFSKCPTCVSLRPEKGKSFDKDKVAENKKSLQQHLNYIKGERNYLYTKRELASELYVVVFIICVLLQY